jgi:hypothetical protein
MAWTAPRTWVSGEVVTAPLLNTHLRDNLNFIGNPMACKAYHNANVAISAGVDTYLALNSEEFDTGGMHDLTTNTGRVTAVLAGWYVVEACIPWVLTGTGYRWNAVVINRVYTWLTNYQSEPTAVGDRTTMAGIYRFNAGDYAELLVRPGVAATVQSVVYTINGRQLATGPSLAMFRLGDAI